MCPLVSYAGAGVSSQGAKRLTGYVAGVGTVYKFHVPSGRVTAEGFFGGSGMNIGRALLLSSKDSRLYVTGENFDSPLVAFDDNSMKELARLDLTKGVPPATWNRHGRFTGYEFRESPDGSLGFVWLTDAETGNSWLQIITLPDLIPKARIENVGVFHAGPHSSFLNDNNKLLALYSRRDVSSASTTLQQYIGLIEARSGTILQEVILSGKLEASVPASLFVPEAKGVYVVSAGVDRWLLPARERMYAYLSADALSILVAETVSGKVLHRHKLPRGTTNTNGVTLTPDGGQLLLSRGSFRPREGEFGELLYLDRITGRVVKRQPLIDGATSNVVFRFR